MRVSELFTKTRKDAPADEPSKNAQLLIKAGFIHKEMAGVYVFMPLGLRVLDNIKQIVREEMNAVGGQEVQMTVLQPKDIFEKTDRWDDKKVDNWFKTKLINGSELGMGLTHEEPMVDMLADYVSSYKDLPILVYQIQNKFRNELRAQAGLLRGREFVMKDMYSFAKTQAEHEEIYEKVAAAYHRVYDRLGIGDITYRTYADGGIFTPRFSDEFQMLSPIGEDTIYVDIDKKIAVNKEVINDKRLEQTDVDKTKLQEERAIEVGNIFPLESKYTDTLGVYYIDEAGNRQSIIGGCYGIGVSRLVGALAEHFSDEQGLVWPEAVAPAKVYLVRLGEDGEVVKVADSLYEELQKAGVEVLYDDRKEASAGEKFADADLLGIPHRLVVSQKTLEKGKIEHKKRDKKDISLLDKSDILKTLA
ncbi:prolyl-tRNA synthetase [Candidatus Saccharibacteria bacterium RIFCSPHIGHO2_02_FULL_47_12]|nr:MAG: prolyl-tRNA synthetase [Candidatus Saccharibacteria bacterium RIFCSPHIGHO2_02_FULL_47_12]